MCSEWSVNQSERVMHNLGEQVIGNVVHIKRSEMWSDDRATPAGVINRTCLMVTWNRPDCVLSQRRRNGEVLVPTLNMSSKYLKVTMTDKCISSRSKHSRTIDRISSKNIWSGLLPAGTPPAFESHPSALVLSLLHGGIPCSTKMSHSHHFDHALHLL